MKDIAFLGAGRMASAIVDGLLARKVCPPDRLHCTDGGDGTAAQLAARTGINSTSDVAALLAGADTVVLACKPQQLAGLDPRMASLAQGKLVLSILAGKRLDRLAQAFPLARNLVRAMPNTPGQIGAGITAWCSRAPLNADDRIRVDAILGALGAVITVEETQLDAVTGVSGSGPAYVFEFAAALREAGVAAGLPRPLAAQLALETLLGSARLLATAGLEPEQLRDQVTSPNGTTFAGLQRMAARDFRGLVAETVQAATARSRELSQDA
jgi:pyrroline-5-carboxylate reductase